MWETDRRYRFSFYFGGATDPFTSAYGREPSGRLGEAALWWLNDLQPYRPSLTRLLAWFDLASAHEAKYLICAFGSFQSRHPKTPYHSKCIPDDGSDSGLQFILMLVAFLALGARKVENYRAIDICLACILQLSS